MGEKIKVVGLNSGYFLGYNGKKEKYLKNPLRSLIGNRSAERERLDRFIELVEQESPDIVGLVEIDMGSIRTGTEDGQISFIRSRLEENGNGYRAGSGFKYRDLSILKKVPVVSSMANGVLTDRGEIQFHHLERGWKRLMIEVEREDLSVFIVHLPYYLFDRTKEKQIEQISEIISERDRYVIFGDFNIDGMDELDLLRERNGAEVFSPGDTYPAYDPRNPYDLFITGPGVEMERHEVLDVEISDHLGIKAEIELGEK
ncbi:MAG: endonuclease/exonuclease/phosphatase family protein [Candidatus Nanohaloarchaea archaeon]